MKNTIDDAIYVASTEISRRRYNPFMGILLTAISIGLLWANGNTQFFIEHDLVAQWNLLIASCVLCTGLTMICYRLFGDSSAPIETKTRERLYRLEYSFEKNELPHITAAVEKGDFSLIQQLPRSYQPSTQVICYRTDSGSMIAAQVIVNQEPASEIRIFHNGEYAF